MTDKEAIKWFQEFQNNLIKEVDPSDTRLGEALCATQRAINALEDSILRERYRGTVYEIN